MEEQEGIIGEGQAQERVFFGDNEWGFGAKLNNRGQYSFTVKTKDMNLAQIAVLKLLHDWIGKELDNNVKVKIDEDKSQYTIREDE